MLRCQGTNSDELDMVENEQLEVVESEGDGWIRVCVQPVFFGHLLLLVVDDGPDLGHHELRAFSNQWA